MTGEVFVRRLRDTARRRIPVIDERAPINIREITRDRLRHFLMNGPGQGTGIGFTEFIEMSLDLWEQIEVESLMTEAIGPFDSFTGARIKTPESPQPHYFHGPDRYGPCDVKGCGLSRPAHKCDDCGRNDGTHNMEVEH
jgi:hypothetical protein